MLNLGKIRQLSWPPKPAQLPVFVITRLLFSHQSKPSVKIRTIRPEGRLSLHRVPFGKHGIIFILHPPLPAQSPFGPPGQALLHNG